MNVKLLFLNDILVISLYINNSYSIKFVQKMHKH